MQAHYRSILDLSNEALEASERGYKRLMDAVLLLPELKAADISTFDINKWKKDCYTAMNDDFNTPILIAHLFEAVKQVNLIKETKASLTKEDLSNFSKTIKDFVFDVLGMKETIENSQTQVLDDVVHMLIKFRNQARADKNWVLSDEIRDELAGYGVQLKDGKDGTTFSIN